MSHRQSSSTKYGWFSCGVAAVPWRRNDGEYVKTKWCWLWLTICLVPLREWTEYTRIDITSGTCQPQKLAVILSCFSNEYMVNWVCLHIITNKYSITATTLYKQYDRLIRQAATESGVRKTSNNRLKSSQLYMALTCVTGCLLKRTECIFWFSPTVIGWTKMYT